MAFEKIKYFLRNWILPPGIYRTIKKPPQNESPLVHPYKELLEKGKSLKDRHINKRCFILGSGSSIKQQDLKKLQGEYVISLSNSFVHPDFSLFKPQYHALPYILYGHTQLYGEKKFIDWMKEMDEKIFDAEIFLHIGDKRLIDENKIFKNRKINWVEYCDWNGDLSTPIELDKLPYIYSVSELAISLAIYMGFSEIYLLGFDHDWFNGPLVYFYDEKTQHKVQPNKETLEFADSEFQMRRHADIFKKYKYLYSIKKNIYNVNANLNSYVDVFPKRKFEDLFK